ncbi:PLP-dependent aminotransferase family protein [Tenacibaculum sp. IB213877]|uniref:MocR-like pyridoxine biosynthesis transcription factor PdxR n=1 Tax=Tenacibaculum sp. IB213877 TaxID=3097351 RepID=UPI002A5A24CA|nr:PLP-dependent aminotransferase family protein [Tenacibaculum sp. IB213877]MDY0781424.1 PLP-dependent aminotransferase family protein [Tenacibaculum sp. IB213877]
MNTNNKFVIERIQKAFNIQKKIKPQNKYIVLYRSIKQCIVDVELPHNWLLPATRILAEELDLSRTTVIKAYELLLLEKLIISKKGSGNRINYDRAITDIEDSEKTKVLNENLYPVISQKGKSYLENIPLINRQPNTSIAFRPGLPPLDVFPVNQWKKLLNTYWRHIKSSGLSYSQSTGVKELKKSIANYLNVSRNIKCNPEQIVIVSGSLQSLYLITNALIDKGDSVVLENPVFPNVHSIFKSSQANLLPINLDHEGISIDQMNALVEKKPKIIHVTPSNHYPLGVQMSLKRRKELLQWASKNKSFIIENDYENEIANSFKNIPTIYSLDTEDRTIYMGTFNRLLHPSIRLGYMVVPKYLVSTIEALQEHSHRFISPSIQVVMNQFIEKNYLYKHIKTSIEVAKERYDLFISEFELVSKNMFIQQKPFSSFHLIAYFKYSATEEDETEIIKKLTEHDVIAFPLSKCYITSKKEYGLILGYSSVRPTVLKQKIKKIASFI